MARLLQKRYFHHGEKRRQAEEILNLGKGVVPAKALIFTTEYTEDTGKLGKGQLL